jgi:hypothetical protein
MARHDDEPFNISRESFDSYRRSFDISARCPVPDLDAATTTITAAVAVAASQSSVTDTVDDSFEDIQLDDDVADAGFMSDAVLVSPRKRGLFSRFAAAAAAADGAGGPPAVSGSGAVGGAGGRHYGFSFAGRKRAQSVQVSEMASLLAV